MTNNNYLLNGKVLNKSILTFKQTEKEQND